MTNPAKEKPTILLTGFGPFGIHNVNASELAVKQVKPSLIISIVLLYFWLNIFYVPFSYS